MQTSGLTSWATDSLVDEFYVKLKFDQFQTLRNSSQQHEQHATGCENGRNM